MALGKDCTDCIKMGLWVGQKLKTPSDPLFFPKLCCCFYLVRYAGYYLTVDAFYVCRETILPTPTPPGFEADVRTLVDTVGESVDHLLLILEVLRDVTIERGLVSAV